MSRARAVDVSAVLVGVAAAFGGAIVAYLALSSITRPAGVAPRLAAIARQADDADRIASHWRGEHLAYPSGAVCEGGADAGIATVRQNLTLLISRSSATLTNFDAQPQSPDESDGGLQPIRLTISASGSSAAVQGVLQALSKSTPSIFADTLDLTPTDGAVLLKFSGRIFCSPVRS